jgi:hypothetical protein
MDSNLVINASVTSGGQGVNVAQGIYTSGQTVNQTLVLVPGQQYASPIGFSALTISMLSGGPVQLSMTVGSNTTSQLINSLTVIDNTVDSFVVLNPNTNLVQAGVQLTYTASTGTNPPVPSLVTSVDGLTGDVTIKAVDNSEVSGTTLISDSGATTGIIKLKTLVEGSGVTFAADANGNLQISAEAGGGDVASVNGQTGVVVISAVSNNNASGNSLITDSGASTGTMKFVTLVAGPNTTIAPDVNGNLEISSSGGGAVSSVNGQTGAVTVLASDNNAATGTTLIVSNGASTGDIKLKTVVAGTGISLSSDVNGNLEISGVAEYTLPVATTSALGGVIVTGPGIGVNSFGDISNTGVLSVNTRSGAVTLTSTDVGIPTDLLSGTGGTLAQQYLPASLLGAVSYQSTWNASTNTPEILTGSASSANKGFYYVVAVAGTTTVDGTSDWNVGDWIISDGTIWGRLQVSQTISTVNGQTGAVVVEAVDNNDTSGVTLITDSGATTGQIKLKTLVAGSGIALFSDTNGNLTIAGSGYTLPEATTTTLGGVIVGSGISVNAGTISVSASNIVSSGAGISISGSGVISALVQTVAGVSPTAGNVPLAVSNITGAAPLASPAFTGVPTAPTAISTTNNSQIATTAFVQSLISSSAGVLSFNGRTGAVTLQAGDLAPFNLAPLASPALSGVPTAPTASPGTDTTQLATTAFVQAAVSGATIPIATTTTLGGVIVPALGGLSVNGAGALSIASATTSSVGGIIVGPGLSVSSGFVSANVQTVAGVSPVSGNVPLAVSNITGAAPSANPVFTGRNQYTADSFVVSNLGSISGAQTLNLQSAAQFIATLTGNTTFAFSNPPASGANQVVLLRLINAGGKTINWPTGTLFAGGTPPTLTISGTDLLGILYDSVAAVYMVFVIGLNLLT